MIIFDNLPNSMPYRLLVKYYDMAKENNQKLIEAIAISSYDVENNVVDSRFVNLKYVVGEEWIFFSNYESKKAKHFQSHKQISALLHWNLINVQIRMSGDVVKTSSAFSDMHFQKRIKNKNALAISSRQSNKISSYEKVKENYDKAMKEIDHSTKRPEYWGGYSFSPNYFEYWIGDDNRLNKRDVYEKDGLGEWKHFILQP